MQSVTFSWVPWLFVIADLNEPNYKYSSFTSLFTSFVKSTLHRIFITVLFHFCLDVPVLKLQFLQSCETILFFKIFLQNASNLAVYITGCLSENTYELYLYSHIINSVDFSSLTVEQRIFLINWINQLIASNLINCC